MSESNDALETLYGAPSDAGFGSAVFRKPVASAGELEDRALECYRHFVGDLWARYGEAAWMGPWKTLCKRGDDEPRDVLAMLQSIEDPAAASAVPILLDVSSEAEQALRATYDDPAMHALSIFAVGDGEAMSGQMLAGAREDGEGVFLILLMD
jgi:hypothetical protein